MRKIRRMIVYVLGMAGMMIAPAELKAASGDTTWVQAHRNVQLDWYNYFNEEAAFPDGTKSYRNIHMIFELGKYICPGNPQYCADWDYTVQIFLMTPGKDTLELGKLITPYAKGQRMPGDWKGRYVFDVTDFYPLLKNNATVSILYSGYSGGFTADIRFAFVEGERVRDVTGIQRLWGGSFDYGNPAEPISGRITPVRTKVPAGTSYSVLKSSISGHGADDAGCSEFCRRSYRVMLNNTEVDKKLIWREDCGENWLYPQSGTWIYNRANWCPGDLIRPDIHPLPDLQAGQDFTLGLDFDAHSSTTTQGGSKASYILEGILFHYGPFLKTLDVAVEDILSPSDDPRYFRQNNFCGYPQVRVRNTGAETVTSMHIAYEINGSKHHHVWQGTLTPLADTLVTLPEPWELRGLSGSGDKQVFNAHVLEVNGAPDADPANNRLSAAFTPAPLWPMQFVVSLRTNRSATAGISQSEWAIYDMDGRAVYERKALLPQTGYEDTLMLGPGCYRLEVRDAGCDGLSWWANAAAGNGSFRIRPLGTQTSLPLPGYFNGDFGCGFSQYFTTQWPLNTGHTETRAKPEIYPNPGSGTIHLDLRGNPAKGRIEILDMAGRKVHIQEIAGGVLHTVDTGSLPKGVYLFRCTDEQGALLVAEKITIL